MQTLNLDFPVRAPPLSIRDPSDPENPLNASVDEGLKTPVVGLVVV